MSQYSVLPQFEDIEIQESSRRDAIRSITILKETKPDGSVVRRKETILVSGQTLVEEKEMLASSIPGTRMIPTSPQFDILPLYHHHSCSVGELMAKHKCSLKDDVVTASSRMPCRIAAVLLMMLLIFQAKLFHTIVSGDNFHHVYCVFRKFFVSSDLVSEDADD